MEGNFVGRGVEDGGHCEDGRIMLEWNTLYPYQTELPELLLDCFHMSFQSGVVFCNSQAIRTHPCQLIENWTPEFEFRVYHST